MRVQRVRVGDVLRLERRSVVPEPDREYELIGVYSWGKGIFHRDPTLGAELGNFRYFDIQPGDLVLSNIQAWEGAIALAAEKEAGTIGTHRFLTYVPADDRIRTDWARWFFLSEPGMALIRQAAPGTTMRNRTLAIERFENLEIPLPAIDVQVRTAQRLGALRPLLNELGDRLDRGAAQAQPMLPALIDEVLLQAADGWVPVGDLVDFVSDTVHPGDDPAPADRFVGLQHIEGHTGQRLGFDDLADMKGRKFRFRPGDLVYGYLRPYLNKVWVADAHGLCSVDQYVLRARDGVNAELLSFALRGRGVLRSAVDLTHSLQLPRLRSGLLAGIEVPAIPDHLVDDVLVRARAIQQHVLEVDTRRDHQKRLAAAVLPAALNAEFGEFR